MNMIKSKLDIGNMDFRDIEVLATKLAKEYASQFKLYSQVEDEVFFRTGSRPFAVDVANRAFKIKRERAKHSEKSLKCN